MNIHGYKLRENVKNFKNILTNPIGMVGLKTSNITYQEWQRDWPDEARQPAFARC
jgi:hypothetical protein